MKYKVLTLFPEQFDGFCKTSIIKKGIEKNKISIEIIDIRNFSTNKHKNTDDYPYGGGPGMVMTPQPLADAIKYAKGNKSTKVIYFSPRGKIFNQNTAFNFSNENELILLCGHYEGIDERIIQKYVDIEISLGDYILTGGELPAMIFIDSVSRLIDGVLGNTSSFEEESFSNHLLEYPQYTRPETFENMSVPKVLLSGNHKEINKWRLNNSIEITKKIRPDLYENYNKINKK